jgi:hypothetical protein
MKIKKLRKILKKVEKLKEEIELLKNFNGSVDDDLESLICIVGDFLISNSYFDTLTDEEKLLVGEYMFTENSCLGFGVMFHNNNCEQCRKIREIIREWGLEKYLKEYMGIKLIPRELKKEFCIAAIMINKEKILKQKEAKIEKLLFEINNLDKV